MKNTDVYKQAEDCLLEDMDGEMLLYNPENATTLHLNGPSIVVWELCDGKRSVQDIIDMVMEAYPDQSDQISNDVQSVIKDLSSRTVLEIVS